MSYRLQIKSPVNFILFFFLIDSRRAFSTSAQPDFQVVDVSRPCSGCGLQTVFFGLSSSVSRWQELCVCVCVSYERLTWCSAESLLGLCCLSIYPSLFSEMKTWRTRGECVRKAELLNKHGNNIHDIGASTAQVCAGQRNFSDTSRQWSLRLLDFIFPAISCNAKYTIHFCCTYSLVEF